MAVTASQLRQDVYRLLDRVLESGEPLTVERKGRVLRIEAVEVVMEGDKLARIRGNPDAIVGDPDELVDLDWSREWKPWM